MSIRQIAKRAGFSPTTVSMALRNSPKISSATRVKIHRCARQLSYRPDAKVSELMARLRSNRNGRGEACFAVISFYDSPRPWERTRHTTRIYQGMTEQATALGYRLEPLLLRAPGMSPRRFRGILDARGIEGLLCFGSPDLSEELPDEFDHYAIVTVGSSMKTSLHRVTSHMFNDMTQALNEVCQRGYRRPGLVLGHDADMRSQHMYLSAYLGWCNYAFAGAPIPVLRVRGIEVETLRPWLDRHQPDVLVFTHSCDTVSQFAAVLHDQGVRVPDQIGVAVVAQILEGTGFSGMQQNHTVMGARAIELLVGRIMNHDFGIPTSPRIEMVESQWINGASLLQPKDFRRYPTQCRPERAPGA